MTQVSVDEDGPASYFSPVLDGGGVDVTLLPMEKVSDSGGGQMVFITCFISGLINVT